MNSFPITFFLPKESGNILGAYLYHKPFLWLSKESLVNYKKKFANSSDITFNWRGKTFHNSGGIQEDESKCSDAAIVHTLPKEEDTSSTNYTNHKASTPELSNINKLVASVTDVLNAHKTHM